MSSDDAETVVPGPERCLEVLDDIVRTWRVGTGGPTVHTRFARQFVPVIWANTCHLVALAEGLVALHRAGLHLAAMPLVRQIIEFAMRCVWMERYRENVGAVIVEGAKKRRLALETAVSTGILASDDPVVAEAREVVANAVLDQATSGKVFEWLCQPEVAPVRRSDLAPPIRVAALLFGVGVGEVVRCRRRRVRRRTTARAMAVSSAPKAVSRVLPVAALAAVSPRLAARAARAAGPTQQRMGMAASASHQVPWFGPPCGLLVMRSSSWACRCGTGRRRFAAPRPWSGRAPMCRRGRRR